MQIESFNINHDVVFYPTESGWKKMVECLYEYYNQYDHIIMSWEDAKDYIEEKKTEDGGYREQLWVFMATYGEMFFNGTQYWENMNMTLLPDPYDVWLKESKKLKNRIKRWYKNTFK
jgi:hypothetical protein